MTFISIRHLSLALILPLIPKTLYAQNTDADVQQVSTPSTGSAKSVVLNAV